MVRRTTGMMANIVGCPETVHKLSVQVKEIDEWSVAPEAVTSTARQGPPWKQPVGSAVRRGGGQL